MAFRRFTLLESAARSISGDSGLVFTGGGGDEFHVGTFLLKVTARSGTLPTLDVYVQVQLPDDSFADLIAFARIDESASLPVSRVAVGAFPTPGSGTEGPKADGTSAKGSILALPLGPFYRVKWVIAGTASPSFTFEVVTDLYGSHLPGGAE